jgi:hypothetical protein
VARRLAACLRDRTPSRGSAATSSGSCPTGPTDLAGAASVAWKIEQALETEFLVEGQRSRCARASASRSCPTMRQRPRPPAPRRPGDVRRQALGPGLAVFAVEQEEAPARRLALLSDLRHCVEREELVLHYQPKIDLATRTTIGVEALVRWNHPRAGCSCRRRSCRRSRTTT